MRGASSGYKSDAIRAKFRKGAEAVYKFRDSQPRRPAGGSDGGQFAPKGGGGGGEKTPPVPGEGKSLPHMNDAERKKYWDDLNASRSGQRMNAPGKQADAKSNTGRGSHDDVDLPADKGPDHKPANRLEGDPYTPETHGPKSGTFFFDLKNKVKNNPVEHTAPFKETKGAQIKALRQSIKARNASKPERMNQHGADPAAIESSIKRANAKDRARIKQLSAKISRFSD